MDTPGDEHVRELPLRLLQLAQTPTPNSVFPIQKHVFSAVLVRTGYYGRERRQEKGIKVIRWPTGRDL